MVFKYLKKKEKSNNFLNYYVKFPSDNFNILPNSLLNSSQKYVIKKKARKTSSQLVLFLNSNCSFILQNILFRIISHFASRLKIMPACCLSTEIKLWAAHRAAFPAKYESVHHHPKKRANYLCLLFTVHRFWWMIG